MFQCSGNPQFIVIIQSEINPCLFLSVLSGAFMLRPISTRQFFDGSVIKSTLELAASSSKSADSKTDATVGI